MVTYPWDKRMVDRLLKAFAAIRAELEMMQLALRRARAYAALLERELAAGERAMAALVILAERRGAR